MRKTGNSADIRKKVGTFWLICLLYGSGLLYIGYFLQREDTLPLMLSFAGLFALCLYAYRHFEQLSIVHWFVAALFLRLLLLPAIPSLSDDFYRFIWDGHLLLAGEHPFAHIPSWYMQSGAPAIKGITPELYSQLNSPEYFTIYPPLHQITFLGAAFTGKNSLLLNLLALRIPIILAEAGTLWLIIRLLHHYQMPKKLFLLYALNPLVILELAGNLHFEAVMLFFLLLGIYLFHRYQLSQKKAFLAGTAAAFAAAIASKLLPLMFLPLLLRKLNLWPLLFFLLIGACSTLLLFLPLYTPALFSGFQSSLSLYYQKFEFNASLYYVFREIGYWMKGYNIIQDAGRWMFLLATGSILLFSLSRQAKKLPLAAGMFWVYALFLLFSLTVHPWYIIPLLSLSLFTPYRFPVLWSGLAFLTYAGYQPQGFQENPFILWVEYGGIIGFFVWELWAKKGKRLFYRTEIMNKTLNWLSK